MEDSIITKEDYLATKFKLKAGNLDQDGLLLFYDYWTKNKKGDLNPDFPTFMNSFTQYLQAGINFQTAVNKIIKYYDNEYVVTKIMDKSGTSVLTEY